MKVYEAKSLHLSTLHPARTLKPGLDVFCYKTPNKMGQKNIKIHKTLCLSKKELTLSFQKRTLYHSLYDNVNGIFPIKKEKQFKM